MEYIQINSVDDIDVTNITLRDINKRYIDREGFRYATRFNLKTRKIEIVRIIKGKQEAGAVRHKLLQQKKNDQSPDNQNTKSKHSVVMMRESAGSGENIGFENDIELTESGDSINIEDADIAQFSEPQFMEECASDMDKIKERLNGIINLTKKSGYFEANRSDEFLNILRDIDVECIQRCDDTGNYYKELISYPRPASHYLSRMNVEQKALIETLDSDEEKLEMIRRLESQTSYQETYSAVLKVGKALEQLLAGIPEGNLKSMDTGQRQAFNDALGATTFLNEGCQKNINTIQIWKKKYS